MKKIVLILMLLISIIFIWWGEARKIYCLDNGKCLTVWKTYNNICYVIPGKYYGLLKPTSRSFIQTTNVSSLDIIWERDSTIANIGENAQIVNNNAAKDDLIINYNLHKEHYDSLFTSSDGRYRRYKKTINYISIFISGNYALDKNGKKL